MTMNSDARQEKGYTIAQTHGYVKRVDPFNYTVRSQSGNGAYEVLSTEFGGYVHTNTKCH